VLRFQEFFESEKFQIVKKKISPSLIEPEFFHLYSWLQPQNSSDSWFYSLPSVRILKFPSHSNFYSTLDPGLAAAVKHLHQKGISTTPSCTGHFHPEETYKKIWQGIESTCDQIRKSGVCFLDPETGREHTCYDPHFQIPCTHENFIHQALQQGHQGVLGMFDPDSQICLRLRQESIPGTRIQRDRTLTLFLTSPENEQELTTMWENFTDCILQI